jgi:hypothetical protein
MRFNPQKFQIRYRTAEQGNYTGHPWLVDYPVGHRSDSSGYSSWSTDGASFDTFDAARACFLRRLAMAQSSHRCLAAAVRESSRLMVEAVSGA